MHLLAGAPAHFACSCILSTAALAMAARLGPSLHKHRRAALSLLGVLALGCLKEAHDQARNPWNLTAAALLRDTAADMAWNLAGAAAGLVLLAVLRRVGLALTRPYD